MAPADLRTGRAVGGVMFVLLGVGFLLDDLDVFAIDLVYVWPLLLIGLGVAVLLGRARRLQAEEARAAQLAVTEERMRIARELHDIVAHGVSLMTIQVAAARRVARSRPDDADAALSHAEQAGRQSLAELRSMLAVLRSADQSLGAMAHARADGDPVGGDGDSDGRRRGAGEGRGDRAPRTPLPGLRDVETLVEGFRQAGVDVDVVWAGPRPSVAPPLGLAAYRIVQESLTNALRHAGPTRARVTIAALDDDLLVEVVDDGPVPGGHASVPGGGHGLIGMKERVSAMGGVLEAGPKPGGVGWRVRALLPLTGGR